jgi:hypothetical protein
LRVGYRCDPENVSKARLLVEQELAAMRTTNVTAAELRQAKALLLRQITLSESSEDAVAGGFVAKALVGLPLDEPFAPRSVITRSRRSRSGQPSRSGSAPAGSCKLFGDRPQSDWIPHATTLRPPMA